MRNKKQIKEGLLEGLLELVLTIVCFGIGMGILGLLGVKPESPGVDFDVIVFLGMLFSFLLFGIIYAAVHWIRRIIRNR